jgi:Mg-chelatase subunit ChlD
MDLETGQILPYRVASSKVTLQDVAEGRAPRQIVVVIDASGSMYGAPIAEAKEAARLLADTWLDRAHQRLAVAACPGGIRQLPTSEKAKVLKAIEPIVAVGSTPLAATLDQVGGAIEPEAGVSRVFVVVSDGRLDDADAVRAQLERLRAQGVTVLVVGAGPSPRLDVLGALAGSSHRLFSARQPIDLGTGYANLATWVPRGG